MSDIVDRLHTWTDGVEPTHKERDAAAEIARLRGIEQFSAEASRHETNGLRADNERLRMALKELLEGCCALDDEEAILPRQMQAARRALEQKP